MNEFTKNKIEELKASPLCKSKEWGWTNFTKKLKGRKVYWSWTKKIHIIDYICPKTLRVWFTENFNGHSSDTNAISEMYLLPKEMKKK